MQGGSGAKTRLICELWVFYFKTSRLFSLHMKFQTCSLNLNSLLSLQHAIALRELVALAGGLPEQQLYKHHAVAGSHVEEPADDVTTELLKLLQKTEFHDRVHDGPS